MGGGPGALIGPVHRISAELDGEIRLVAGAFASTEERSREAGRGYGVADDRAYPDWQSMLSIEAARADGAQFVTIATPNHLHLLMAVAALEAGFHVLSDKSATRTLDEALHLRSVVRRSGMVYALSYTYSGYPLIRQAPAMVAEGAIGAVRKVVVEYAQGWLAEPIECIGSKQAEWRVDPARAGIGGCISLSVAAASFRSYRRGIRRTGPSLSADPECVRGCGRRSCVRAESGRRLA